MFDGGELGQRNLCAVRSRYQYPAQRFWIGAIFGRVANTNRKSASPLDGHREVGFTNRVFNDLLGISDADTVASSSGSIDLDVQVLPTGDLLGIHVARARYSSDH